MIAEGTAVGQVDPGVGAAVQAGQQHDDYHGVTCNNTNNIRPLRVTLIKKISKKKIGS